MPSNDKEVPQDFEALRRTPVARRMHDILKWWPSKKAVVKDVLREMPPGTSLTPSAVFRWQGERGISRRWIIPLLRAIERRHGLVPIRLSKVPAARRAATLAKLRELYGLSIDWSVIEPMLADRQPQGKDPKDADTEK
mgnify:CR=1 FL=1